VMEIADDGRIHRVAPLWEMKLPTLPERHSAYTPRTPVASPLRAVRGWYCRGLPLADEALSRVLGDPLRCRPFRRSQLRGWHGAALARRTLAAKQGVKLLSHRTYHSGLRALAQAPEIKHRA
jgi:hypothetical protein